MAGLTSEFGMGSGDPRLHGRARGGCSRGQNLPRPAAPRHPGGRIAQHRVRSRNVDVPAFCEEELGLLVALA